MSNHISFFLSISGLYYVRISWFQRIYFTEKVQLISQCCCRHVCSPLNCLFFTPLSTRHTWSYNSGFWMVYSLAAFSGVSSNPVVARVVDACQRTIDSAWSPTYTKVHAIVQKLHARQRDASAHEDARGNSDHRKERGLPVAADNRKMYAVAHGQANVKSKQSICMWNHVYGV